MEYLAINRQSWDQRLKPHLESNFYNMKGFLNGDLSLNKIELDLLEDIEGLSVLHLQCHFGQDTISLSRLGALPTGVDFSEPAIEKARQLASQTESKAQFICSDVYSLREKIDTQFDRVFTSYGTIAWLPDLQKWAQVIAQLLKPGGQFIFAEFHPVVWMFDDELSQIQYPYLNRAPIVEEEQGTYADKSANFSSKSITWNHGLSEVVTALIDAGLNIRKLAEFDYSPYPFVKHCVEFEKGKFRIKHFDDKIPLVYSLIAEKHV